MAAQKTEYDIYVEHLAEIRRLSSPSLEGIKEAGEYSCLLRDSFLRISELAAENREILNKKLFPRLSEERELSQEQIDELLEFSRKLVDAESVENLDLPIANLLSEHLLKITRESGDISVVIRQMDKEIESCYALMNMVERITCYPELVKSFRVRGLERGRFFRSLLDHEEFAKIGDMECREMVLTNARYAAVFYENCTGDPQANQDNLDYVDDTLKIADDPFYAPLVPDFNWDYYRYRTLQYIAMGTNYCNRRGFTKEQLLKIEEYSEAASQIFLADPEGCASWDRKSHVQMYTCRNRYLTGMISEEEYIRKLLEIYYRRNKNMYDAYGLAENVQLPAEVLYLLAGKKLSKRDISTLQMFYHEILDYVLRMPNSGTFSFLLEFLSHFLERFIETPGGMTFAEMMQDLLAALHPPTYVHTRMVAQLVNCLCDHLLNLKPELFIGIGGCRTVKDVEDRRQKIMDFTYQAALCHDIGKVFIVDTIFVYGRNLLDMEFDIIKTHPRMGADMLSHYPSTAKLTDAVIGHHKWYDNSRGYPEEFDARKSPLRTIIYLLQCADCLEAATDTIGRSYKRGKTLDEFLEELKAGSGTQYAPWLVELLSDGATRQDVEWFLSTGRENSYREAYHLLKKMHERVAY